MSYQRTMRRFSRSGGGAWAAVTVVCLSVAATGGALAGVIMQATDEQAPPEVVPPIHREVPDDPYIAVRPDQRRTSPAFRAVANGFVSVQVNVDDNGDNILGDAANEPSLAIDPTNTDLIAIGWRQFDTIQSNFRQAGRGYTRDGGQTWTFPGVLDPGNFRSDPVLASNADGVFYYYSLRESFLCDMFVSFDGGITWGDPNFAFGGDKAWFTIDTTDSSGRGHIYVAWSTAGNPHAPNQFTRSTDGGSFWLSPIELAAPKPRWGTLTVDANGLLYVSGVSGGDGFRVLKSFNARNAGQTPVWAWNRPVDLGGDLRSHSGPNPGGLLGQTWIATDRSGGPNDGNVYMLCSVEPLEGSDPLDVMFVRSTNGGFTWSDPVRVNDDPPHPDAWQWFGTMAVAPNGRIDVIWNDTRNTLLVNFSQLFYAFSTDGGRTWSENIRVSPRFNSWVGWPNQTKIGDYYDMISDNGGASLAWAATFNNEQDVYYLRITASDCPADLDDSGAVDIGDLLAILSAWGNKGGPEDLDGSGFVDIGDLLIVLAAWGPCPE